MCDVCDGEMRPLFSGMYCPNECDRLSLEDQRALRLKIEMSKMPAPPPSGGIVWTLSSTGTTTPWGTFAIPYAPAKP